MAIHYNGDRFVGVAPPTENHGFLCSENEKRLGKRGRGREGGERSVRPREILASGGAATFESSNRPGEGRGG